MSGRKGRPLGDALESERGGDAPLGRPFALARSRSAQGLADALAEGAIGLVHSAVYFWW